MSEKERDQSHADKERESVERVAKALCRHAHPARSIEEGVSPSRELWQRFIPEAEIAIAALCARSAVEPIGEQIARDTARELDNVAALIMTGRNMAEKEARIVTSGARMIERLATRSARTPLMDLHRDLGTLKWIGSDQGWDLAIKAVRSEIEARANATDATTDSRENK